MKPAGSLTSQFTFKVPVLKLCSTAVSHCFWITQQVQLCIQRPIWHMASPLALCEGHFHGIHSSQGWACEMCHVVWLGVRGVIQHICHRTDSWTADCIPLQVLSDFQVVNLLLTIV